MKIKSILFASIAVSALAAPQAVAQTASGDDTPAEARAPDGIQDPNEIVVTAQKRSESILNVPLSVTAVDPEGLTKQNLVRLQDYATRIPGLVTTGSRTNNIAIRGVNAGGATSPTVAVTIDDVPFGSTSWAGNASFPDLDPSDIQRIEVLRGPQGTLYGASSLGGLIKYVTRDADSNDFSGRISGGVANANEGSYGYSVRGSVNVPLIKDMLGIRVSAYRRDDPRLGDRYSGTTAANAVLLARDIDAAKTTGFRVAATFTPIDILRINVSHLQQVRETTNSSGTRLTPFPTDYKPLFGYFGNNSAGAVGKFKVRQTQVRGELDLGAATLTSISGWGRSSNVANSDSTSGFSFVFAGIPAAGIPAVYPGAATGSQVRLDDAAYLSKFSQEVRLASNGSGPLTWLVGGFYTNEHASLDQEIYAIDPSGSRIGSVVIFPLPSSFREYAAFADLNYAFNDSFDVEIGGRYSKNKQTYQANQTVVPTAIPLFGASRVGAVTRSEDDAFTWVVSPRYHFNKDVMLYARVATGYRPGGPNTAVAPLASFEPDTVTNYEVGLKGEFLNRAVTLETALFNIDWKDVQIGGTTLAGVSFFTNGGKARSRGMEASVSIRPGGGWTFNGNMTIADAKITEDLPAIGGATYVVGKKNDPLPYAPKFTSNLGFEKSFTLVDDVKFTVGGNFNHVSQRDSAFRSSAAPVARQGKLRVPGYDLIDLHAGYGNGDWDVTLFVRNLTDERGFVTVADSAGASTTTNATFVQPRTVGVDVSFTF